MFQGINLVDLRLCVQARWTPKIGDPNLTGWLTVGSYLVCAALAVAVLMRVAQPGNERRFWALILTLMLFLAVNKQLDLQSALTATGRCIAQFQGWYSARRAVQHHVIEGLLVAIAAGLGFGLYLMRRESRRNGVGLLGLVVVAGYVALRAVGFHHFETVINTHVLDVRANFFFENAGLVLIAVNALCLLARRHRPSTL